MRSRKCHTISAGQVQQWALSWLIDSIKLPDHGWKCTAVVVWNIVLRAAARMCSLAAACRDLADAPSDQAVFDALHDGLPKTWKTLEGRSDELLLGHLLTRVRKRSWNVAIDWHLVPYYGQPDKSENELRRSKPQKGTSTFHAYATACIVSHGIRYTLAATWVRHNESMVTVLDRLLTRLDENGLKIRRLLVDRAFYNFAVIEHLQSRTIPFVMPTVLRGRKPKRGTPRKGLRLIARQNTGWYRHTLTSKVRSLNVSICVSVRSYQHRRTGKRHRQKVMFACWRVKGAPQEIRELYRTRFGIETSYRQWRQARIITCARDPLLRLLFVVIGLMLRNLWLWLHATLLAPDGPETTSDEFAPRLELLRFRRLLDWIAIAVTSQLHDQSMPCVQNSA